MDRKGLLKNCHFRHGRENVQKFLTFVEDGTRFPERTNPFKVSYSQENQLDGLHVVSSAYFEIQ
ncbi:BCN_G0043610.mRNA.1.CDS.1 [Saccharomyces cerevisiae]|nr:BCN_G0043610.mRNA.1.CDS.1 [Saccharomyces cerevisiae]CAI7287581.1 BCN_G0043610.mRNA.1.CDS.1 [Saccharomyces cerevisiae]